MGGRGSCLDLFVAKDKILARAGNRTSLVQLTVPSLVTEEIKLNKNENFV
jgi:hypothetical protein